MFASSSLRQFTACLVLASLCGCIHATSSTHSSGSISVGSRKVQYDLDGLGGASSADGVISVKFEGGKLDVEKSRLLLNGQNIATFPEDTKLIVMKYADDDLTVTADGATIYPAAG